MQEITIMRKGWIKTVHNMHIYRLATKTMCSEQLQYSLAFILQLFIFLALLDLGRFVSHK